MANWKKYKIGFKRIDGEGSKIVLQLGMKISGVYVDFCDTSYDSRGSDVYNYIVCPNTYPFNTWEEGDYVEVDNDKTRYKSWASVLDASVVRKVSSASSSINVITTRGSSSNIVISSGLVNAMGSSDTMELARHMSRMVDENDKEYELKIEDNSNKRFTYSLICRKQK